MPTNIVRFDPFEDLNRLQRDVNRLFDDSSRPSRNESPAARNWSPAVDIWEDANEIVIFAELPGLKQENIDVEVTGENLTIKGERVFGQTEKADRFVRVERSYGAFSRSFTIGVPVKHEGVIANYRDGILEVHLPKSEETKPKKVSVNIG